MRLRWGDPQFTASDCARWSGQPRTADTEWRGGVVDTYEQEIRIAPADDAEREYQRIRARLFAYDIFSPAAVRGTVCPEQPLQRGATIVQRFGPKAVAIETGVRVEDVWDEHVDETPSQGSSM
jgi:hypothetical protein